MEVCRGTSNIHCLKVILAIHYWIERISMNACVKAYRSCGHMQGENYLKVICNASSCQQLVQKDLEISFFFLWKVSFFLCFLFSRVLSVSTSLLPIHHISGVTRILYGGSGINGPMPCY